MKSRHQRIFRPLTILTQLIWTGFLELMEEEADTKPKRAGCCLCKQRRAALKRPKTLEQVNSHPCFIIFLLFFFFSCWSIFIFKRYAGSVSTRYLRKRSTRWLWAINFSSLVSVLLLVPLVEKVGGSFYLLSCIYALFFLLLCLCFWLWCPLVCCRFHRPCLCFIRIKPPPQLWLGSLPFISWWRHYWLQRWLAWNCQTKWNSSGHLPLLLNLNMTLNLNFMLLINLQLGFSVILSMGCH